MQRYTRHIANKRRTPQGQVIPGRAEQMTKTSDGAYAFKLDASSRW